MNTKDHKLYVYQVEYDSNQRIHCGIDDSVLVPAHYSGKFNVLAPNQEHATLVVRERFDERIYGYTNVSIRAIDTLKIDAALVQSTYL